MLASGLIGMANDAWDPGMYNLYQNRTSAYLQIANEEVSTRQEPERCDGAKYVSLICKCKR
jgi:hypothetical protein